MSSQPIIMKKSQMSDTLKSLIKLVVLVFLGCTSPQADTTEVVQIEIETKLDQELSPYIEQIIESNELPGVAVGLVKDNKVVYAKAFGYLNVETKQPLSVSSMFHMASVSKPFVATAIMQLVEQGKIDLDAPVIQYLPYFRVMGDDYDKITIKQMLNHISGMPDVQDYQWDNPVYSDDALERYVRSISQEKMRSKPGDSFAYSNMAFECLGDVIAKVSGLTFADYQKEHILKPSGMNESTFLKPADLPENWAGPHVRMSSSKLWDGYPYNRMHGPSSTLHSNVLEMCNWAIINMNHGEFNNKKILDPESYELLWNPWFEIGEENSIGLSWFINNYNGEKTIGHGGGDVGFSTNFVMLPEKSIAAVVMSNQSPAPVNDITNAALDIMLGFDLDTYTIPASISVTRELNTKGLDAAVALWDSLQANHAKRYDFNPEQFSGLFVALYMDEVEEAETLTQLCVKIFPDEVLEYIREETESYLSSNPTNKAAPVILKTIPESSEN